MNKPVEDIPVLNDKVDESPPLPQYIHDVRHHMVDHPKHYNTHQSGVECIDVIEHMPFNIGTAIKYCWRCDEKGRPIEDLQKAIWYLRREVEKRTRKK